MEESGIQDLLREYFKYNHFDTTLECFEAEVRSQNALSTSFKAQYRSDRLPRLYSLVSQGETQSPQSSERRLEELMTAARGIFSVSVEAISSLEEAKLPTESFKEQLAKLQSAVGLSVFKDTSANIQESAFRKQIAESIRKGIQTKDNLMVTEALLTIRAESLGSDDSNREKLINALVNDDILDSSVTKLLNIRNFHVKYTLFGVISILCCIPKGKSYVLEDNDIEITAKLMNELKEQEQGSVCQRFLLSILGKLTSTEDNACEFLVKSKFVPWILQEVLFKQIVNKEESKSFCHLFASALLLNLVNYRTGREYCEQMPDTAKSWMTQIVELLQFPIDSHSTYHLLLALSSVMKSSRLRDELNSLQLDRKMMKVTQMTHENCRDEMLKELIISLCDDLAKKTPVALEAPQSMPTIITFECFPDEMKFSDLNL